MDRAFFSPDPLFPSDYYWTAEDGRVYASARQTVVTRDDAALKAWLAAGNLPTPWPRDDAGAQTSAALTEVLTPLGLTIDGKPLPPPVPNAISRRQFFMQLAVQGDITQAEAIAAMSGTIPPEFETLIAALPTTQQFGARMAIAGTEFDRSSPLVATFGAAKGRTSAQVDDMWRASAAL